MAVARLAPTIANRLKSEQVRERWENLREGTLTRTDEVLGVALPEPPEKDELLGQLPSEIHQRVTHKLVIWKTQRLRCPYSMRVSLALLSS
jgi:hypothetical protein